MALYTGLADDFVSAARNDSRNEDKPDAATGDNIGFADSDFVRYLNYAQETLQTTILKANPGSFKDQGIISCVANQEQYTVTDRVFAGERIVNVQFSYDGQTQNYQDLRQIGEHYRRGGGAAGSFGGYPQAYIRRSSSFLLYPIPSSSSGTIRVVYERQLDDLCMRVGKITSYDDVAATLTLSNLNTEYDDYLLANSYICVSDPDGVVLLRNGKISSFTSPTLTLNSALSGYLTTGSALTDLTNSYITLGKYSTTHTKLNQVAWRYMSEYACLQAFKRDSSSDFQESFRTLDSMKKDILEVYQDANRDEMEIQIINPQYIVNGDNFGGF